MSVVVAVDRGATIMSLVHRPSNIDLMWKPDPPGPDMLAASEPTEREWHRDYRGGWQTILPNFGHANTWQGTAHQMHGEAARVAWDVDDERGQDGGVEIAVSVRLETLPLRVRRVMRLDASEPVLEIVESVTNFGNDAIDCMWGHHPVFGPPFLSPACVVDTGARRVMVDGAYAANDLDATSDWRWPNVGATDLSIMPPPKAGSSRVVTLAEFDGAWYALTNRQLSLGIGIAWTDDVFPYACMWQESTERYALAIEPQSSFPGHGVRAVAETTGTQLTLGPRSTLEARVTAVLYDGSARVRGVSLDGRVDRA